MKSEKIAASICWLTAALLFAVDQINLHLAYLSLATLGYSTDIGYIDRAKGSIYVQYCS